MVQLLMSLLGLAEPMDPRGDADAVFQKARHVKYWLRCLKTLLPTAYTPNDSQRMTFAFFTLSALDLLSALDNHTTTEEREGYVDWIYRCQHTNGGFKGFTGADAGGESCWDPANLAATFFALASLMVLGDDMDRVKKSACVEWVRRLQRHDGSFGEALGKNGNIEGEGDIRHCYLAAAVRWILRRGATVEDTGDIDREGLARYVLRSVTYEGGIAKSPLEEAHAGWTYCGIGVLRLLGKVPEITIQRTDSTGTDALNKRTIEDFLHWLVNRQTLYIQDHDEADAEEQFADPDERETGQSFVKEASYPANFARTSGDEARPMNVSEHLLRCVGLNGRCNKIADTCYAFWVGASLSMLESIHLQNSRAIRKFLLDKTQHIIGGFGKLVGDTPDILHSHLGLAALAVMGDPELRPIDPTLCLSVRAKEDFETKSKAMMKPT